MRSELCVFGLLAIGEIPPQDRAKLDPADFFGHEDDIKALQADAKSAVRAIVAREWPDIDWPDDRTLRVSAIERFKQICQRDRGVAMLDLKCRQADAAKKVLANHRANGGVSLAVVQEAEAVLIGCAGGIDP